MFALVGYLVGLVAFLKTCTDDHRGIKLLSILFWPVFIKVLGIQRCHIGVMWLILNNILDSNKSQLIIDPQNLLSLILNVGSFLGARGDSKHSECFLYSILITSVLVMHKYTSEVPQQLHIMRAIREQMLHYSVALFLTGVYCMRHAI